MCPQTYDKCYRIAAIIITITTYSSPATISPTNSNLACVTSRMMLYMFYMQRPCVRSVCVYVCLFPVIQTQQHTRTRISHCRTLDPSQTGQPRYGSAIINCQELRVCNDTHIPTHMLELDHHERHILGNRSESDWIIPSALRAPTDKPSRRTEFFSKSATLRSDDTTATPNSRACVRHYIATVSGLRRIVLLWHNCSQPTANIRLTCDTERCRVYRFSSKARSTSAVRCAYTQNVWRVFSCRLRTAGLGQA